MKVWSTYFLLLAVLIGSVNASAQNSTIQLTSQTIGPFNLLWANKPYTGLSVGADYLFQCDVDVNAVPVNLNMGGTTVSAATDGNYQVMFTASATTHNLNVFAFTLFTPPFSVELDNLELLEVSDSAFMAYTFEYRNGYRYAFNGMEKDDEIKEGVGNDYYTFHRHYDPRVGRWLSVDIVDKFRESRYAFGSNSPIVMVDPNGDSDYYSQSGQYLGSDGSEETDIIVITNDKIAKTMYKENKKTLKADGYVEVAVNLEEVSYFKLPSYEDRQEMKKIMVGADQGAEKGRERGGRGLLIEGEETSRHYRAQDGIKPNVGEVAYIEINTFHESEVDRAGDEIGNKDYTTAYSWHSHPDITEYSFDGVTWYTEEAFNEEMIKKGYPDWNKPSDGITLMSSIPDYTKQVTGQGASVADMDYAKEGGIPNNYVLVPKYKKVYYFTDKTRDMTNKKGDQVKYEGSFPLQDFYDVKAKPKPEEETDTQQN